MYSNDPGRDKWRFGPPSLWPCRCEEPLLSFPISLFFNIVNILCMHFWYTVCRHCYWLSLAIVITALMNDYYATEHENLLLTERVTFLCSISLHLCRNVYRMRCKNYPTCKLWFLNDSLAFCVNLFKICWRAMVDFWNYFSKIFHSAKNIQQFEFMRSVNFQMNKQRDSWYFS